MENNVVSQFSQYSDENQTDTNFFSDYVSRETCVKSPALSRGQRSADADHRLKEMHRCVKIKQ